MVHCPSKLVYQFTDEFKIKCSDQCCYKLKKEPAKKWSEENKRTITITGMRKEEGGNRNNLSCVVTDSENKVVKFHPLAPVSEEFEEWFINKYNIQLCKLYYPPYNFKRTGCRGCPFALELKSELDMLSKYLKNERTACEIIWKPVYDEYRRIGYRLSSEEQQELDL